MAFLSRFFNIWTMSNSGTLPPQFFRVQRLSENIKNHQFIDFIKEFWRRVPNRACWTLQNICAVMAKNLNLLLDYSKKSSRFTIIFTNLLYSVLKRFIGQRIMQHVIYTQNFFHYSFGNHTTCSIQTNSDQSRIGELLNELM